MKRYLLTSILITVSIIAASCNSATSATPTASEAAVTLTPTSTPSPLGSQTNPVTLGVISPSPDDPIMQAADQLVQQIAADSGLSVQARPFTNYQDMLVSMQAGQVSFAWMPAMTYIYANGVGLAEVSLLTNHFGVYQYGSRFYVNQDSGFTIYYNEDTGQNTAIAAAALQQLEGLRPCFTDEHSISGYVLPQGLFSQQETQLLPPVFTQSYTGTIRALYIRGICDFGVVYAYLGDPRTSSAVLNDLGDAMTRVVVLWQSEAVIPNTALVYHPDVQPEIRQSINASLLTLAQTPDGIGLLSTVLEYDVQALHGVDDSLYNPLRELMVAAGINIEEQVGY
ncbi:MAG TPA: PhnD/SsuA/transferrin family substrate-binding protein [Longilinea sp.]|nr:PhnD/SsuA/transferrin family substrate-binding protein [Longilinea sp.]